MVPPEPYHPTTATPRHPSIAEAQENDLKSKFMKMIEVFNEEMNKSHKEEQEENQTGEGNE